MRFLTFSLMVTTASCFAACGGNVVDGTGASTAGTGASTTGTGASTTGTGASTTGTGGGSPAGDCTTDADCGTGTCAPLTPGGYLVCLDIPPAATSCSSPMSSQDQCCTSTDCKSGQACYSTGTLTECAGGPAIQIYNECVGDQCESDADCTGATPQICAPAGAFDYPMRACFTAYCHTDADCMAQPGGACVTVSQPCCDVPGGLACVYPGGCRKDTDCGDGNTCEIDPTTGTGECMSGPAPCPV
jgi:hypothetical protein